MITKSEAIARFLNLKAQPDLAALYHMGMECQVNVAQDGGDRIEGDYRGRKWHGWSDGCTTWKSFRIPYNAKTSPEYTDVEIKWDIAAHTEGVGMTGWDWQKRRSVFVAFDFDSIVGHAEGLTHHELDDIRKAACNIEWVTVRKSSSGKGLHLFVFVDEPTANHNEHAALARSILGQMSAISGYDFSSKVDTCGGNIWIWHRKCEGTDGFELVKLGKSLDEVPTNWRDHIKVISGKRRRNLPQIIEESGKVDVFEELAGQRQHVPLDEEHKNLIEYLRSNKAVWWWDQDNHMLVCHSFDLQSAFNDLNMRGFFETSSKGSDIFEQNCFAFPMRKGAWVVRRYTPGVQEHESWDQDGGGWTRAYLNREPDLATACKAYGGIEDPTGGFVFREAEVAAKAALLLGVTLNVGIPMRGRECKLKAHKDGRLVITMEHNPQDDGGKDMPGWLAKKGNWMRVFQTATSTIPEPEVGNYDDVIRHLITSNHEDAGWRILSEGSWIAEPVGNLKMALGSMGLKPGEVNTILGTSVFKAWKLVCQPFQPEYPGNRCWNRNSPQLRFPKSEKEGGWKHPTWSKILNHCGVGLDEAIKKHPWCMSNGVLTGGDYLKCWVASLFQYPMEPLPYLFFWGPQNSGKSIFHESLRCLLTIGYERADVALTSQQGFNAELERSIICAVEELDLAKNKIAYNRIKDWVTSREFLVHPKGGTPYSIPNSTHWIQCSNYHTACPVFAGDTRITMCHVPALDPLELIPKSKLIKILESEASDFIASILALELPEATDRLYIPVVNTQDKILLEEYNLTPFELFLRERCVECPGHMIKFSEIYDHFAADLDAAEIGYWTKIRVGKSLPPIYPKGRQRQTGQHYIGNIAWKKDKPEDGPTLVLNGEYLEANE